VNDDIARMTRAIELAAAAEAAGDVPIGCVVVLGDVVVETHNEKESRADPTAHAEMLAIREAARLHGAWRLIGATLYVTKEPCTMCAGAIVAARIQRVVYGCADPKGGAAGSVIDVFGSEAVNHRVDVEGGVLAVETAAQLRAFFASRRGRMEEGAPGAVEDPVL
jgi:tRNA(adenine34) deaminase